MRQGRGEQVDVINHSPHPEALARIFFEHGEVEGGLRICSLWRRREPACARIAEVEALARPNSTPARSLPVDAALAERYIQQGYIWEAAEILRYLAERGLLDEAAQIRLEVLNGLAAFELPADAELAHVHAEAHITAGRLSSALLDYRELARAHPTDEEIVRRAGLLRILVLGTPAPSPAGLGPEAAITAQMPLETQALLVLKEGNIPLAADLFTLMARRAGGGPIDEVAAALTRLSELSAASPSRQSARSGSGRIDAGRYAALHVALGNLVEAADLYEVLLAQDPTNTEHRRRLDDVQAVLEYVRRAEQASSPLPGTPRQRETKEMASGRRRRSLPRPDRALGKRSGSAEFSAFRPALQAGPPPPPAALDPDEAPTEVVSKEALAEIHISRGYRDQALRLYEELLVEDPESLVLQQKVAALRRILRGEEVAASSSQQENPSGEPAGARAARAAADGEGTAAARPPADPWAITQRGTSASRATPRRQSAAPGPAEEPAAEPRLVRTMLSRPPTVDEEEGRSVVEVPRDLTSIVERTPGRIDAAEAAEIAEPLGVAVRPILIIE